jgi:hypothetical protein
MKSCPSCNRTYTDASLNFCLEDGTPLTSSAPAAPGFDPNATIRYTDARETKPPQPATPPPSVPPGSQPSHQPPYQQSYPSSYPASYQPTPPIPSQGSAFGQQQYAPPVMATPRRKSNAVWWILGGGLVLGVIAVGAVIMILALASMDANENGNANRVNTNTRNANRNANTNTNTNTNINASLPALLADDFSETKWATGSHAFGEMWYADDQYHMRAKEKHYLVMYAPAEYNTANATVSVTARSVDGTPPLTGYGLIIHGEKKGDKLEDYALLIYTGDETKYQIIKHKDGDQKVVVPWTKSSVIRSGTNPNRLEIRARNTDISFYINGQYVDRITDSENFKNGVAGLYTSDVVEVAFDDLEIKR